MATPLAFPAAAVFAVLLAAVGCTSDQTRNQLVGVPSPTPTALATERPAFASASPKAKPTAPPKKTTAPISGSFYKPPGWDGHADVNCSDFDTHAHAQSFFKGTGGSTSNDPYHLDADHDGLACESLP